MAIVPESSVSQPESRLVPIRLAGLLFRALKILDQHPPNPLGGHSRSRRPDSTTYPPPGTARTIAARTLVPPPGQLARPFPTAPVRHCRRLSYCGEYPPMTTL